MDAVSTVRRLPEHTRASPQVQAAVTAKVDGLVLSCSCTHASLTPHAPHDLHLPSHIQFQAYCIPSWTFLCTLSYIPYVPAHNPFNHRLMRLPMHLIMHSSARSLALPLRLFFFFFLFPSFFPPFHIFSAALYPVFQDDFWYI